MSISSEIPLKYHISFLSLLVFVLAGCVQNSYPKQSINLFGEEGCGIGCWQGLHLGMTHEETSTYFQEHFPDHHPEFEYEGTYFYTGVDDFGVQAYRQEDRLQAIWLGTSQNFNLNLQSIIDELGAPPYVHWSFGVSFEVYDIYPHILLYYPEQGYVFDISLPRQNRNARTANNPVHICPKPQSFVSDIYIVNPNSIERVVWDADHFLRPTRLEYIMNNLVLWSGFECRTFEISN